MERDFYTKTYTETGNTLKWKKSLREEELYLHIHVFVCAPFPYKSYYIEKRDKIYE